MTPTGYKNSCVIYYRSVGGWYDKYPNLKASIVPVINIKSNYISNFIGDGTINNPFHLYA